MKKYFLSELKRNRNALIVLTVLCAVLSFVVASKTSLYYEYYDEFGKKIRYNGDGTIGFFVGMLIVLCAFVPAYVYAFKMKKRSVDAYYSLPIRREGLYFIKTLIGLLMVFIPYTVAYSLGVSVILCRENYFQTIWYLPYYFVSTVFGALLYFFYAFIFTRANRTADGVVLMIAWTFVVELVLSLTVCVMQRFGATEEIWRLINGNEYFDCCHLPFGFLIASADGFSGLLGGETGTAWEWECHGFLFALIAGIVGGALLFLTLPYEKAENAEQISSSWWGYRVLVPVYLFAVCAQTSGSIGWCFALIAAFVGFVVYRRSVKLKWADGLSLVFSLLAGIILSGILS